MTPDKPTRHWHAHLKRSWIFIVLSALLLLGIVQQSFFLAQTLWRSAQWQGQAQASRARSAQIEQEVAGLKDALAAQNDPNYLESRARCLGFVKESETVILAKGAQRLPANADACPAPQGRPFNDSVPEGRAAEEVNPKGAGAAPPAPQSPAPQSNNTVPAQP